MAESTSITVAAHDDHVHVQQPQQQLEQIHEQLSRQRPPGNTYIVIDKTLAGAANLVKLLPCGTVIAFQALSPPFSNCGLCQTPANKYLTIAIILLCALSCCFFSFTDSFIDFDGKLYYGIATFKGLYIFNSGAHRTKEPSSLSTAETMREELKKYKITFVDFIHAFFSCLVFMSLALGDPYVHRCFFEKGDENTKEWLANLPLGVGFLSSLVFIIFPTSRKGIGYPDRP